MYDLTARIGRDVRLAATWDDGYRHIAMESLSPVPSIQLSIDALALDEQFIGMRYFPPLDEFTEVRTRFEGDVAPEGGTLLIAPVCVVCLPDRGATYAEGLGFRCRGGHCTIEPVCSRHEGIAPALSIGQLQDGLGHAVLWGALSDQFVINLLALSDHVRGVEVQPGPSRRYVHELARGDRGATFIEHLRVDAEGRAWVATWSRIVAGEPGIDIPIRRLVDGRLEIDVTALDPGRRPKKLTEDDVTNGFAIPVESVVGGHHAPWRARGAEARD